MFRRVIDSNETASPTPRQATRGDRVPVFSDPFGRNPWMMDFFSSFSLWASYRSEMWTREIDAAEDRSVVIRLAAWFARQTEIRTRRRESDFRWKDLTIPRNRTVLQFWNDFAIKMTIRINKPKKSQAQRWTDNIVWNFYW